jgi:hypothetical protein
MKCIQNPTHFIPTYHIINKQGCQLPNLKKSGLNTIENIQYLSA